MKRFLQDAVNIFDAAVNVVGIRHPTVNTALLIGDGRVGERNVVRGTREGLVG